MPGKQSLFYDIQFIFYLLDLFLFFIPFSLLCLLYAIYAHFIFLFFVQFFLLYSNILIFAFQWRKGLKLSGETAVEKCTLDGVKGLRVMLSATVHDVLYYMSPIYCQDIINAVVHLVFKLSVSIFMILIISMF